MYMYLRNELRLSVIFDILHQY